MGAGEKRIYYRGIKEAPQEGGKLEAGGGASPVPRRGWKPVRRSFRAGGVPPPPEGVSDRETWSRLVLYNFTGVPLRYVFPG